MLKNKPGKNLNTYLDTYVLFDLETTGISVYKDKVIEIAAIKVENGFISEEFSSLVNPKIPIPYYATDVNGITDEMVKDSPAFETVLEDFLKFAGEYVLVGHNIQTFDLKFIYRDSMSYFGAIPGNDYIDTLQLARIYLPEIKHHSLTNLAKYYNINSAGAHRAMADCKMNQRIFESLKEEIEHPSEASKAVKRCPRCGNVLRKKDGKYGPFFGCMSYPDCRYTENI